MIKINSFFSLPVEEQRLGPVYSIANTYPERAEPVAGTLWCLVPPWGSVAALREGTIDQEQFITLYRQHVRQNWPAIKAWLDSLDPRDELYLCCWERTGFCHRVLVARLIRHFRPDLKVRLT
jgi:hypothetical protein